MKFFPTPGSPKWEPRQMFVTFVKREYAIKATIRQRPMNCKHNKTVVLAKIGDNIPVTEIQYVCQCDKVFYDKYGLPVVRG